MAIAVGDQLGFIGVVRQMLSALHDQHVIIRAPDGAATATYDPGYFINWDRAVWQSSTTPAAPGTQGQGDWGHGTLNGIVYFPDWRVEQHQYFRE